MDRLTECRSVLFDELTHSYFCGDKMLIGVTSLMKKHGLSADYGGIPSDVLDKAAAKGSAIHELLEDYDNGETVVEDENLKAYKKLNLKVLRSEYLVSDNEVVATFIDKVLDDYSLADVKTTSEVHTHALEWQLSICAYLFEMQNKGIKVPALYCIHVRNRKAKLIPVNRLPDSEVERLIGCEAKGEKFTEIPIETAVTEIISESEEVTLTKNLESIAIFKQKIKEAEAAISEIQDRLYNRMKEYNLNEVLGETGKFVRRVETTRISLDTNALKEKKPKIYEAFKVETKVKGSITFKPYK
jgi:hypothetical protein